AGAFYWPLFRAHKELTTEYASLNRRAQTIEQELGALRTELTAAKAKRDELEARRGMDQTRDRSSRELLEQVKGDLGTKLSRFVDKGTLTVAIRQNRVIVRLPSAVVQTAARADMSPDARIALCALSSVIV